jgi:peptidoglycan/LPS O-acetylase OafA/YrhL
MKTSLKHIKELDGMRGCAALAVLVLHLFTTVPNVVVANEPVGWRIAWFLANFGTYGVDVFFVLSGFLITSLLLADREGPHYFRNFYWKRVLRIQPVYLVHLLVMWFFVRGSHGYVWLSLMFLVNFLRIGSISGSGPAWTLSIEEQFYLLWPQIVRRLSLANIYRSCMVLVVFSAGLRGVMLLVLHHALLSATWYRFDGLALGALLGCEWMAEGDGLTPGIRRVLRVLHGAPCLWIALVYELYCAIGHMGDSSGAFFLLSTNLLVYRAIRYMLWHPGTRATNWLRSRPLLFLGTISYGMYMYHIFFLWLFDHYSHAPFGLSYFLYRAAFAVGATLIVCVASLYWLEMPIRRLGRYVVS